MSELVDRDLVLNIIDNIKLNRSIPKNYGTLLDIERQIRRLPTTKGVKVTSPYWIVNLKRDSQTNLYTIYICSNCGRVIILKEKESIKDYPYCLHCGVRMMGKVEAYQ